MASYHQTLKKTTKQFGVLSRFELGGRWGCIEEIKIGEETVRSKCRRCLRALSLAEYHFRDIYYNIKSKCFFKRAFNKCPGALYLNFPCDESKVFKTISHIYVYCVTKVHKTFLYFLLIYVFIV